MKELNIYIIVYFIFFAVISFACQWDSNDFATEYISYIPGILDSVDYIDGSQFNNPSCALGRPTIDTTGNNGWPIPTDVNVPVVSVYSAFRSFELVKVGLNGRLVLKFNHHVADDENNPYGLDFIIFGNTQQDAGSEKEWDNSDPNLFTIDTIYTLDEPAIVKVSQTGNINNPSEWYSFDDGPFADTWAPTFGRVYDPCNPDNSIGSWNLWWSYSTNPVLPLDPNLMPEDFAGHTIAYMSQIYGNSAGGTGFDLKWLSQQDYDALQSDPETGKKWIQYIWIQGNDEYTPEIDAVSDVACCGDYKHPFPTGDLTEDCRVDYLDIGLFCYYWLEEIYSPQDPANAADIYEDNVIDFHDWAVFSASWNSCTWECD